MDKECFTASAYIEPRDSLYGAYHVFRIVGKKAIRSISVESITDHSMLLAINQGRIAANARIKHILSKFVTSFVPYPPFKERHKVKIVTTAATPVAHDPGPPPETTWPRKTIVVTMAQISHVYV